MSYCRWSYPIEDGRPSEAYVFAHVDGGWTTMLADGREFNDPTPRACSERLVALKTEGLAVPQFAIDDLAAEGDGDQRRGVQAFTFPDAPISNILNYWAALTATPEQGDGR